MRAAVVAAASGAALEESLKWGEPSYRLVARRRGKALRLNLVAGSDRVMLLFHCRTELVARFREQFGDALDYQGNRAVILRAPAGSSEIVAALARQAFAYTT